MGKFSISAAWEETKGLLARDGRLFASVALALPSAGSVTDATRTVCFAAPMSSTRGARSGVAPETSTMLPAAYVPAAIPVATRSAARRTTSPSRRPR